MPPPDDPAEDPALEGIRGLAALEIEDQDSGDEEEGQGDEHEHAQGLGQLVEEAEGHAEVLLSDDPEEVAEGAEGDPLPGFTQATTRALLTWSRAMIARLKAKGARGALGFLPSSIPFCSSRLIIRWAGR